METNNLCRAYEMVLHTALPSELSTSESWPNVNSTLHPTLALGPVVRLWACSLYRDILRSASWDSPFRMSDDAVCEVLFWQDNFNNSGYPIWSPSPKPEVLSFADASESGWGGFTAQVGGKVAVGSWQLVIGRDGEKLHIP